jgi:hypothetical protein
MNPLHWKREYQVAWKHRGVERQSDKDGSKSGHCQYWDGSVSQAKNHT